ncbi:MAG: hypothetical protein QXT20_04620 [Candidatus Woesearchaeota archaeon]
MAKTKKKDNSSTSLNMQENIEALLCYVLGWLTGIIFLILEKKSRNVKFHAWQSILTFGSVTILNLIFGLIPIIGVSLTVVLSLISFILWIVLMVKAYNNEKWHVPIIGDMIEKSIKY